MKRILTPLLILFSMSTQAGLGFGSADELLRADDAFAITSSLVNSNSNSIDISWKIADGYYLYDDKFKFATETQNISLGGAKKPQGKMKSDPNFGDTEIHRNFVTISIPLSASQPTDEMILKTGYQGCADLGVCYPPQTKKLTLALADLALTGSSADQATTSDASPASGTSSSVDVLSGLRNSLGIDEPELLPADEAFAFDPVVSGDSIIATWKVAEGYYLYKDKIKVSLINSPATVGQANFPPSISHEDPLFGTTEIYRRDLSISFPVDAAMPADANLYAEFQGCADLGVCYPPIKKNITLASLATIDSTMVAASTTISSTPSTTTVPGNSEKSSPGTNTTNASNQADESPLTGFDAIIRDGNLLKIALAALGAGLLLAFTACMYPMIPILSSIIVGQGEKVTAVRGFTLSLVYVLALAVTFGVIGALTATLFKGIAIQAYFQSPWLLIPFIVLFIALSMSMFGFYDIQIPSGLQSKLNNFSNNQKGGNYIGVAIMGALSALIIGPCGGPVLVAALSYAAATGNVLNGFTALFALGLGMGLPLLLVGIGGGSLLPKAGNWMSSVKAVGGVILLAVALIFLERMPSIFPTAFVMMLWSALLIVSGIYLGAFDALVAGRSNWFRLWKGLGLFMVFYGLLVMVGGLTGGSKATDPLHNSSLFSAASTGQALHQYTSVKTVEDLQREIRKANSQGKTAMLDFYADWCVYCKTFDQYVFPDPRVQEALKNTVLLKADVTATDAEDSRLMKSVDVVLPPAILFYDLNGNEMRRLRVIGGKNADEFYAHINAKL